MVQSCVVSTLMAFLVSVSLHAQVEFGILITHKSAVTSALARHIVDNYNTMSQRSIADQINRWHHDTYHQRELSYW